MRGGGGRGTKKNRSYSCGNVFCRNPCYPDKYDYIYIGEVKMQILDDLEYTEVQGVDTDIKIIVLGSASCKQFRAALEFLNERELSYSYTFLDALENERKMNVVGYIRAKYGKDPICPFIILGDKDTISGFNPQLWEERFQALDLI
jgi:hypothetical protein